MLILKTINRRGFWSGCRDLNPNQLNPAYHFRSKLLLSINFCFGLSLLLTAAFCAAAQSSTILEATHA